jgi:hypothetical protein
MEDSDRICFGVEMPYPVRTVRYGRESSNDGPTFMNLCLSNDLLRLYVARMTDLRA